jgi:hypothetical protein
MSEYHLIDPADAPRDGTLVTFYFPERGRSLSHESTKTVLASYDTVGGVWRELTGRTVDISKAMDAIAHGEKASG